MTTEQFEQILAAWLDEPQRADLRVQVDAALRENPEWTPMRDQWLRIDQVVRADAPALDRVDWSRVKQRILAAAGAADLRLDALLGDLPTVDHAVDWPAVRERIADRALRETRAARRPTRRWLPWVASAGLAAAAVIALSITLRPAAPAPPTGSVQVAVVPPAQPPDQAGFARVRVEPPAGEPQVTLAAKGAEPELFLLIEPAEPRGAALAYAGRHVLD